MTHFRPSARDFLLVCACLAALAAAAALVTHLELAVQARALLSVHFAPVGDSAAQALGIFAHNARLMGGILVSVALVGLLRSSQRDGERLPRLERGIVAACDALLFLYSAASAILAGVLLGAYGTRQLHAFLPHGPDELCAYALCLALYLDARRRRLSLSRATVILALALAMLALAAAAEVHAGAP